MDVSPLVWWLTIGITTAVLLFDIVVIGRRPHEPSAKEVSIALGVFVGMAVAVRHRGCGSSPGTSTAPSSSPAG